MSYTLLPESPEFLTISDCGEGDKPLEIPPSDDLLFPTATNEAVCLGIIGGADGPTTVAVAGNKQGKLRAACSSLYFAPVQQDIEWRITFYEKKFENFSMMLIEK